MNYPVHKMSINHFLMAFICNGFFFLQEIFRVNVKKLKKLVFIISSFFSHCAFNKQFAKWLLCENVIVIIIFHSIFWVLGYIVEWHHPIPLSLIARAQFMSGSCLLMMSQVRFAPSAPVSEFCNKRSSTIWPMMDI